IKSGSLGHVQRRFTARDVLLAVQIAMCAVLVTSSFVAVQGLARSLHANLGFDPQNALLMEVNLQLAGYKSGAVAAMQKRMVDEIQAIPGITSAGLVGLYPPLHMGWDNEDVFTDKTTDFRSSNAAAIAVLYSISPGYFRAADTRLLLGRSFTWNDGNDVPRVAVINQHFARKIFGSAANAIGKYFKLKDAKRIQVVGVAEDGKYTANLAEDPQLAMFFPILQSPSNDAWLVVRSNRNSQDLAAALRDKMRSLDSGLPAFVQTWSEEMNGALFAPRMATLSLGVLGFMGAILSITGIFGMAAYAVSKRKRELGIRIALGAQRKEVLQAALGRPLR
ncbi:MAG: ABC transporter permease, partial [Candidatus Acidiferrales bacterium]